MKTIILSILFLAYGCLFSQIDFEYNPNIISSRTKKIISGFQDTDQVEGRALFESGISSKIYPYFEKLSKKASTIELLELSNHPNPIIRYYSFWALWKNKADKKYLLEVVKEHLKDTITVDTQFGCIESNVSIGDYMLYTIEETEEYGLNKQEKREIDSLLFWQEGNSIDERRYVFEKLDKSSKNNNRLREIVRIEKDPYALLPLLSYGVENDQLYIEEVFDISPLHALKAIKLYPNLGLVPKIKTLQLADRFDYPNGTWNALYEAALAYDKKTALDIFLNIYVDKNTSANRYQHAQHIYRIIREDTSRYLDPVKLEIALYLGDMTRNFYNSVWEIDSAKIYDMSVKKITEQYNHWLGDSLYHTILDKMDQIHGDSTIHIINTSLKGISPGNFLARLAISSKKYKSAQTDSIIISRFNTYSGSRDVEIKDLAKGIISYNEPTVFMGIEDKAFEILENKKFDHYYWQTLIELAIKSNRHRSIEVLLFEIKEAKKDKYFLNMAVFMLLKLEDKEINQSLVNIYKENSASFIKSDFGETYQRHLTRYGLL